MTARVLHLGVDDDVAIALEPLARGTPVDDVVAVDDIPGGHKIALRDLPAGALVHKYGHVIGMTGAPVRAGEHVHTHNLTMPPNATEVAISGLAAAVPAVPADLPRTFRAIVRPDGRVATRNYIGVLTTVNCSATVAKQIVRRTEDEIAEMHPDGSTGPSR